MRSVIVGIDRVFEFADHEGSDDNKKNYIRNFRSDERTTPALLRFGYLDF